jgi:5-methylcytosine-specific restriction endonuclease McrA
VLLLALNFTLSSRNKIPKLIQEQVRQRARFLCEYCHASEQWQYVSFTVDHVIPLNQGEA